jgi:shikimate kinase
LPIIHNTINQQFMKIILLGYMGSGKSTVAKQVAIGLNIPVIDLDDYIEENENKSIASIFKTKGEIYFRLQESKYLKQLLDQGQDLVLALGGGTPCYANNIDLICSASESFYLKASIKTLSDRLVKEKEQRPLIASFDDEQLKEFIAKHLFERRNFYEQAKYTIAIDGKTMEEIAEEIRIVLKN